MPFKHFPLLKHPELISSYCSLCGELVAASPNPEILTILERLHDCPQMRKHPARQFLKTALAPKVINNRRSREVVRSKIMMQQTKAVHLKAEAVDALQALSRALFRRKFGREPGPDDPVVFDPDAETPQRASQEKHQQLLAKMGEAAGLPSHFVYAMEQTGFIVTEHNIMIMPKEKIEMWERAIDEYLRRAA